MSAALVWEVIRPYNSFVRKGLNGSVFSAEPGNLYNKHSYKYSAIADPKTIVIAEDGDAIKVIKSRSKNASKPKSSKSSQTLKSHARRVLLSVGKEVASFRPDLKSAALARASAVTKSQRAKKAKKTA